MPTANHPGQGAIRPDQVFLADNIRERLRSKSVGKWPRPPHGGEIILGWRVVHAGIFGEQTYLVSGWHVPRNL